MASKVKSDDYPGVQFIYTMFETATKGQKPTADFLYSFAESYKINFPLVDDGSRQIRNHVSGSSIPMNFAVDLKTMKIVYQRVGFSSSEMDSFIKSFFFGG